MKHTSTLAKIVTVNFAVLLVSCQPVTKESSYNSGLPDTTLGVVDTTLDGEVATKVEKKLSPADKKKILGKFKSKHDEFQGITWYSSKDEARYSNNNQVTVYMGEKEGNFFLRFRVVYYGDDWLFVQNYQFLIDGEVVNHTPEVEVVRDNSGGNVWESTDESVDENISAIIRKVSTAKVAKIRYEGRDYRHDRVISAKEKKAIKEVLDAYDTLIK